MNTYSHIVVAGDLFPYIKPENAQEYYWGAVAPDIRYLVGLRRSQTHFAPEKILGYGAKFPQLMPFLQGYLVHCLTDELDLAQIIQRTFPLSLLRKKIPPQYLPVILELFYFETRKPNRMQLSGKHNPVFHDLGISEEQSLNFAEIISQYISSPSIESAMELIQKLGISNNDRINKYLTNAERFKRNRVKQGVLFFGFRAGKIHRQLISSVLSLLPSTQI